MLFNKYIVNNFVRENTDHQTIQTDRHHSHTDTCSTYRTRHTQLIQQTHIELDIHKRRKKWIHRTVGKQAKFSLMQQRQRHGGEEIENSNPDLLLAK